MTNRETMVSILSANIEYLANILVKTVMVNDGDYFYDGEDEYWEDSYTEKYISPIGDYLYDKRDECVKDTIEWLNKEVE